MPYTIGEVSRMTGLPVSTLRYYDKNGLLPPVGRSEGNIRLFGERDLEWIRLLECLKSTGMPLKDIRTFRAWKEEGDSTIPQRLAMLLRLREETEAKIAAMQETLGLIERKCEFYRRAEAAGTTDLPTGCGSPKAAGGQ